VAETFADVLMLIHEIDQRRVARLEAARIRLLDRNTALNVNARMIRRLSQQIRGNK
jgi:hypothetical protein